LEFPRPPQLIRRILTFGGGGVRGPPKGLPLYSSISIFYLVLIYLEKAQDILAWLYSGNVTGKLDEILKRRTVGTGGWFLKEFHNGLKRHLN
jgi:hypothetical protein